MRFRFDFRAWLLYLFCLATPAHVAAASDPQWFEIKSPNFSVVTDTGEKRGREIALHLEKMRTVFVTLLNETHLKLPPSPRVVALRTPEEMKQFAPLWNGRPTQVNGFFEESGNRSYVVVDMSAQEPWRVILHEFAHQVLNGGYPRRFDPWFSEGFAGYFASLQVDPKQTLVGAIAAEDFETLHRDGMFKIADLFRVGRNSRTYNESGDHRSVFYAQSTVLVHYFYDNSMLPAVLKYLDLSRERKLPLEDAIVQAFGMNAAQLDKALRDYVDAGRFRTFAIPIRQETLQSVETIPLGIRDQLFVSADIHLHSRDYQQRAVKELKEIHATLPYHTLALRALGSAYIQQRKYSEARDCLRRVQSANPNDPYAHYYSALLISREKGFNELADLAAMKKEVETS